MEVANAATFAGVAVALVAMGAILPRAGVLELLAAVPLAIVAHRHRPRAVLVAALAGSVLGFVTAGLDAGLAVLACAVIGGVVGTLHRHGRGVGTLLALALVLGPAAALTVDGLLFVFAALRTLLSGTIRGIVSGFTTALRLLPPARGLADVLDQVVSAAARAWWVWLFVLVAVAVPVAMLVVWWLLSAVLARLDRLAAPQVADSLDNPVPDRDPAPLPVDLVDVSFRYSDAGPDALTGIDLHLDRGQFVVVVGQNGSGKSTLGRVLAGAAVTGGAVRRPGGVGLGRFGGTALLTQRPETQVLGNTVGEDVVWGLPAGHDTDVDALLAEVGLTGAAGRGTTGLSGGQLQRLAIASALARRPTLLISDESTAMLDAAGRDTLLNLLASLPARHGMTVVHITHSAAEAARADRVIQLAGGVVVADRPWPDQPPPVPARVGVATPATAAPTGPPVLTVREVDHWYGYGTPWAYRALRAVNLDLRAGDGLVITGHNGSGKSTLAWILAGLTRPTSGVCLLDGEPVDRQVGSVAVAFQHPRLQVQRPTVAEDILAAAGRRGTPPDDRAAAELVDRALRAVALLPALAGTSIEALSGGQLRRVALAGLLAGSPRVLILDEPLAGLDPDARRALIDTLCALRAGGLPLIVISHDPDDLGAAVNRTMRLDNGTLT